MDSILKAKWIAPASEMGEVCPFFRKFFSLEKKFERAVLQVTALGVYVSDINGTRVGNFVLAPGWTAYQKRLQYQAYDVTELLEKENTLSVTVGKGWYRGRLPGWKSTKQEALQKNPAGMLASLEILYVDGSSETIYTDESWNVQESQIRFSEIYDGETCDASFKTTVEGPVSLFEGPTETLIPQQGEEVREQERVSPCRIFTTPAGETVVDFGQEITGWSFLWTRRLEVKFYFPMRRSWISRAISIRKIIVLPKPSCSISAGKENKYINRSLPTLGSGISGWTGSRVGRKLQNRKILRQWLYIPI